MQKWGKKKKKKNPIFFAFPHKFFFSGSLKNSLGKYCIYYIMLLVYQPLHQPAGERQREREKLHTHLGQLKGQFVT
jgi:hypothetical protein